MRIATVASALGCTLIAGLLASPFLLADGGQPSASPSQGGAGGQPLVVTAAGGPWFVGGNVPPAALPYVPDGGFPDTYLTPAGECTTWAAFLWPGHSGRGVTWPGDAWQWLANAAAQGYATSEVPSVGAIAVWPRHYVPGSDATQWGHVAVVVAVAHGGFTVTEMNVVGQYRVDVRTVPLPGDQAGFIPLPVDAFRALT